MHVATLICHPTAATQAQDKSRPGSGGVGSRLAEVGALRLANPNYLPD